MSSCETAGASVTDDGGPGIAVPVLFDLRTDVQGAIHVHLQVGSQTGIQADRDNFDLNLQSATGNGAAAAAPASAIASATAAAPANARRKSSKRKLQVPDPPNQGVRLSVLYDRWFGGVLEERVATLDGYRVGIKFDARGDKVSRGIWGTDFMPVDLQSLMDNKQLATSHLVRVTATSPITAASTSPADAPLASPAEHMKIDDRRGRVSSKRRCESRKRESGLEAAVGMEAQAQAAAAKATQVAARDALGRLSKLPPGWKKIKSTNPLTDAEDDHGEEEEQLDIDSAMLGIHSVAGNYMEACDRTGIWYAARVIEVRNEGEARELLMHFNGWKSRHDEWVQVGTGRLRLKGEPSPSQPDASNETDLSFGVDAPSPLHQQPDSTAPEEEELDGNDNEDKEDEEQQEEEGEEPQEEEEEQEEGDNACEEDQGEESEEGKEGQRSQYEAHGQVHSSSSSSCSASPGRLTLGHREKLSLAPIADVQSDLRQIEALLVEQFVGRAHRGSGKGSILVDNSKRYARELIKMMLGGAAAVGDACKDVSNYALEQHGIITRGSACLQKNTFHVAFTKCGEEVIAVISLMIVNGNSKPGASSGAASVRGGLRSAQSDDERRPRVASIVLAATKPERQGKGVMSRLLKYVKRDCMQQNCPICVLSEKPWDYEDKDVDGDCVLRNWWRVRGGFGLPVKPCIITKKSELSKLWGRAHLDTKAGFFCPWPIEETNIIMLTLDQLQTSLAHTTVPPEPPPHPMATISYEAPDPPLRGNSQGAWKGARMHMHPIASEVCIPSAPKSQMRMLVRLHLSAFVATSLMLQPIFVITSLMLQPMFVITPHSSFAARRASLGPCSSSHGVATSMTRAKSSVLYLMIIPSLRTRSISGDSRSVQSPTTSCLKTNKGAPSSIGLAMSARPSATRSTSIAMSQRTSHCVARRPRQLQQTRTCRGQFK